MQFSLTRAPDPKLSAKMRALGRKGGFARRDKYGVESLRAIAVFGGKATAGIKRTKMRGASEEKAPECPCEVLPWE